MVPFFSRILTDRKLFTTCLTNRPERYVHMLHLLKYYLEYITLSIGVLLLQKDRYLALSTFLFR